METTRNAKPKILRSDWILRFLAAISLILLIAVLTLKAMKMMEPVSKADNVRPIFRTSESDDEVPNIVHFIRFGKNPVTFLEAVCMLAALKNQRPNKIYIHTDYRGPYPPFFWGRYWNVVTDSPLAKGVIEVKHLDLPNRIMGKEIKHLYHHASDYQRLGVLMKYGGIYLDNDSYIVKNLSEFFKYEMTLGWNGMDVFNQVLIAKKRARFLRLWRESYADYRTNLWYYNGGYLPAKLVRKVPGWVHTVPHFLAQFSGYVTSMLYYWDTGVWKQHYAIHLLVNHQYMLRKDMLKEANVTYPVVFNETNILSYPINLRQMALDVYPYDNATLSQFAEVYPHLHPPEGAPLHSFYENQTESAQQASYINRAIKMINMTYEENWKKTWASSPFPA